MYSFKNDYSEGAHPLILKALTSTNLVQEEGYGLDSLSQSALLKIQNHLGTKSQVHLLSGGTQTNLTALGAFLRPHEAVVAAATGHIATHETGAIEATGHKVIELEAPAGKLTPDLISPVLTAHHFEHMVKPKLVYISNPTELGTIYSKSELEALSSFCKDKNLILYCDGARLGAALTAPTNDVSLKDMATTTDAFFIGGTKTGALIGEALIINNIQLQEDMRYHIKQRGALLAKGRLLGIQFDTLFTDDLYFTLAKHANTMAQKMVVGLKALEIDFYIDSPTNQIFPIFSHDQIAALQKKFGFYVWTPVTPDTSAIRLITSWATPQHQVDAFIDCVATLLKEDSHEN